MNPPDALPPDEALRAPLGDGYQMHVLSALDGVLIYLTLRGEHVGTYFGRDERSAAAAAAADLIADVTATNDEGEA